MIFGPITLQDGISEITKFSSMNGGPQCSYLEDEKLATSGASYTRASLIEFIDLPAYSASYIVHT